MTTTHYIIDGKQYTVEPDIKSKVYVGMLGITGYYVRPLRGFGGQEFVILTNDGDRIVTHNLWYEGPTDKPDNATFEGKKPHITRIRQNAWERKHCPR